VVSPVFHSIHHSVEPRHHNRNYSAMFSVWDYLFGTAAATATRPRVYGVEGLAMTESLLAQLFTPFRMLARKRTARAQDGTPSGPPAPATLDTHNDACAWCRMAVSDVRFAAQLVAPAEEPRFFDDIGCLRDHLAAAKALPPQAAAYVADHRTKAWVPATSAVYTRVPGLSTPMGSRLIAHADAASREADPDARGGSGLSAADVFPQAAPPGGRP